jgi:hypothetical protein
VLVNRGSRSRPWRCCSSWYPARCRHDCSDWKGVAVLGLGQYEAALMLNSCGGAEATISMAAFLDGGARSTVVRTAEKLAEPGVVQIRDGSSRCGCIRSVSGVFDARGVVQVGTAVSQLAADQAADG